MLGIISLAVIIILFGMQMENFIHVSRCKYIVEDFDSYQKDFIAVADFCRDYIAEKRKRSESLSLDEL